MLTHAGFRCCPRQAIAQHLMAQGPGCVKCFSRVSPSAWWPHVRAYTLLRQVINQYMVAKYKGQGPDLLPAEPELAAKAWLIARIHDMYITPVQVRLQRPCPGSRRPWLLCHARLILMLHETACAKAA